MIQTRYMVSVCALVLLAVPAYAADKQEKNPLAEVAQKAAAKGVPLEDVLDAVSKSSGKVFLVDSQVGPTVVVGQPRVRDMTYPMLLKVLSNNGLAAVSAQDVTSIVLVNRIRQYPTPLLFDDDDTIDDEEWVTRVIQLENTNAAQMVPIMRPLLPQQGHMAAHVDSNTLTLVDRYANVRRVVEMVLAIDESAKKRQGQ